MTRIHLAFFLLIFSIFSTSQVIARELLMDEKESCEKDRGLWREFGNNCADECYGKDRLSMSCGTSIVFGCDCGSRRCWNDGKCTSEKKYKEALKKKKSPELGKHKNSTKKTSSDTLEELEIEIEDETQSNEQKMCQDSGGVWKGFSNTCANNCNNGLGMMPLCSSTLTNSCDCGSGKCWNNNKCTKIADYINKNILSR